MWSLIGTILIVQSHMILGKLVGDHICQTEESYPANVTEYRLRNATFRNYKWCMNVPPRCSYYTVKTINESRIVEKILTRTVDKCCDEYTEENGKCLPKCKEGCKNGRCTNGTCICSSGFKGDACDVGCDPGTWGSNCSKSCDCEDKVCDPMNGICLEKAQTTLAPLPRPSTPSHISINDNVSKMTTNAPSTSTRGTSLINDNSANTTEISNSVVTVDTVAGRSNASFTVATPNDATLNIPKGNIWTATSRSIGAAQTTKLITQSTTNVTNFNETSTTKGIQHVSESTESTYQPKQPILSSSSSLNISVTTSPFYSTLESITSSKSHTGFSQTVSPRFNNFEANATVFHPTTRVTVVAPAISTRLNNAEATSTELHSTTKEPAATSKKAYVQTQQSFIDTTATKTTPLTSKPTTTEVLNLDRSVIVKQSVATSNEMSDRLDTKPTSSWVNNVSETTSVGSFSNSSLKTYSNEIADSVYKTGSDTKTTPLTTSSPVPHNIVSSTPRHAEDHLDKPPAVQNSTEGISNASLDEILKEYTIPVEVKYEIPAHKKEVALTHENYAEKKNYLTLEDRGYINKHVSSDSDYFVNSFTGVVVVVLVVAVLVMMVLGWSSWRGKKALESRDVGTKDAAVYTTSIFHTPLPDPPIIENPTYLLTTIDCKKCNSETLLLKAHPAYPIHRMSQMGEVREYMYDHPPSTGSYRAASAVDPSDVSCSYTATEISEPVYDEIPLRNGVASNVHGTNTEPNMCLYVNTVGRTKF